MNKVILIGNLTRDAELTETERGVKKAKIGIAVNRNYPSADTGDYECDFFTAIAWRKQAEAVAKWCGKGDKIAISGELQNYKYEDVNGDKKQIMLINVSSLEIIKSAKMQKYAEEAKKATAPKSAKKLAEIKALDHEELPF